MLYCLVVEFGDKTPHKQFLENLDESDGFIFEAIIHWKLLDVTSISLFLNLGESRVASPFSAMF